MRNLLILSILLLLITSCKKATQTSTVNNAMYFPAASSSWETVSPSSLNWNEAELSSLYTYLQQKNTKAFIILHNGRIAAEHYFGTFTIDSNWYWASAGKTMTAFLVGIAQQEGKLNINNKTSQYLGAGWTSLSATKENLITVRHQITMTTGLDDGVADNDCTSPACLQYKADAGTRWAYHNAPYTLLEKVVEAATGTNYNNYFQQKIRDKIGMNGLWIKSGWDNVYFSTARSMARFGLLLLNKGKWNDNFILTDADYFNSQINTSQNINLSYGYLTWLNGKSSYMLPQTQINFSGSLIPNAPADTYAALGKNDQKIYVVPSLNIVVIRMGESAGNVQLATSSFDNELWGKLRLVLKL
jgi:CubicO group peptidase (beta-lactamase class C family)